MTPNEDLALQPPDDPIDGLAGQYVLGTLPGAERAAVEARMAREPELRAAVDAWEQRLHPLVTLVEPAEPDPSLWRRIDASLASPPASLAAHPSRTLPERTRFYSSWWHSLVLWRALAGAGIAAAALLGALLVARPPVANTQYLVVMVAPQDKAPGWVVQTAEGSRQLSLIPLGRMTVPNDKALQFWTKADSWGAPVSLGMVAPGQALQVPIEKLPPLEANQLFELTLEAPTGSPTGRPTGPIQFIGRAIKVL